MESAYRAVGELGLEKEVAKSTIESGILGEIPLVSEVSRLGDQGRLGELFVGKRNREGPLVGRDDLQEVRITMEHVAERIWRSFSMSPAR